MKKVNHDDTTSTTQKTLCVTNGSEFRSLRKFFDRIYRINWISAHGFNPFYPVNPVKFGFLVAAYGRAGSVVSSWFTNILHSCKSLRFPVQKSLQKHLKPSVLLTFSVSKIQTLRAKLW